MAKNIDVPMLRFSDNPFSDKSSKHGLWGIGKSYTWLKMSQTPNLESVRQALISYDMRVRKDVECSNIPDKQPDMIIRKIQISDCILNEKEDIKISFNPQMNTIIGGRGSGKSSIIRTIAGAMNSFSGENLNVISEEQKNFYKENGKSKSSGTRKGIFKRTSQVSVFIERLSDLYKIEVTDIKGMENQTRKIFKYIDGEWNVIEDEHFLDLFKAQIFTQKQIYELAMDSNSLMAIIDADIKELPKCLSEKDAALNNLVSKALEISNSKRIILDKPRLETELLDIESQISKYEKSGISDTLKEKQLFDVVITNPPYKKKNTGIINPDEPKMIARHEITADLEDFIRVAKDMLKDKGEFYIVHRPERLVDIFDLMRKYKIEPKEIRFIFSKKDEEPKIVMIKGVKNAKSFLKVYPNLYIYDEKGNYTHEVKEIYELEK